MKRTFKKEDISCIQEPNHSKAMIILILIHYNAFMVVFLHLTNEGNLVNQDIWSGNHPV